MPIDKPLVSVICLCHNQADYVEKAIDSVLNQTYKNIELIVVDDASNDGSKEIIREKLSETEVSFIDLPENLGNCAAFNKGFFISKGEYIIDLAADDELYPQRIEKGLSAFKESKVGVNFCDALLEYGDKRTSSSFYKRDDNGDLEQAVPQGEVYESLIKRHFISAPTMMIKRDVLEELGGYDSTLAYEDFDFWIRSSRNWNYSFLDEILVKKRILPKSHHASQFKFHSNHHQSTLKVCQKIKKLNKSISEKKALRQRCKYEIGLCIKQGNLRLIPGFLKLMF